MSIIKSFRIRSDLFTKLNTRSRSIISDLRRRTVLVKLATSIRSSSPITGDAPAVVCLTSYGRRIRHVHYTIQTIGNGACRPRRIILWISNSDAHLVTRQLHSLQRRGLEVRLTEDYRSHKKYYPYCAAVHDIRDYELPLVTADDDVLYPTHWLSDLIDAAMIDLSPTIVAHRCHRIKLDNGVIRPYLTWERESGTVEPCYANVATGVGGVLYPPEFIKQVGKIWNTEFMEVAQWADDLWLHSRAALLGIPTKQVSRFAFRIVEHHPDVNDSLSLINVIGGNNDVVISRIYTPEMISLIRSSYGSNDERYGSNDERSAMNENSKVARPGYVRRIFRRAKNAFRTTSEFTSSETYWESRYRRGGNSGAGSYNRLAVFKAQVVNDFVEQNGVGSVIEFGSGDGAQLELAKYPAYIGVDVSQTAIVTTRRRFSHDTRIRFLHTSEINESIRAELSLSLDVIYHLVEDEVFDHYMTQLFNSSTKFVIIYSSNTDMSWPNPHVRHRQFTRWIESRRPDFKLIRKIPNPYPYCEDDPDNTSFADFYLYSRSS
jgi:hypothetical protein